MSDVLHFSVPGSKSQTQRALIISALAAGQSILHQPLDCDDTRCLRRALRHLGVEITEENDRWLISGGSLTRPREPLDCGEAGTALRFLAPFCLLLEGELSLQGSGRLPLRPQQELLGALEQLGAQAIATDKRRLSLTLHQAAKVGSHVTLDASRSSQFASGLLMIAPRLPRGMSLTLRGKLVSRPYLELTLAMMRTFGASVDRVGMHCRVPPASYKPRTLTIEGDWSSAAFLLAAAAISGKRVLLKNLDRCSLQGDRAIVDMLAELSIPRPHVFDLSDSPDLIAPLAAASTFCQQPVSICNAAHARLKESDRVAVLCRALRAIGARVRELPDGLHLYPGGSLRSALLHPQCDHRMAMAFGLLSLRLPSIEIMDTECVEKSYPDFWQDLARFKEEG